jgi:subfamily B ATP-binding cassette protein MsbA
MTPRLALFARYLRPYRLRLTALVAALLAVATFEGLGVGLLFPLVEYVQLGDAFKSQGRSARIVFRVLGTAGLKPSVGLFIGLIFTVVLTLLLLKFCVTRASAWVYTPFSEDLRRDAFQRIVRAHLFYFYNASSGSLITILDDEIDCVAVSFNFMVLLITAMLSIFLYVAFILLISWKLTLLMAAIGALRYGVAGLFFRRMRAINAEYAHLREELKSYLVGIHQGIEVVKSYGTTEREIGKFSGLSGRIHDNARELAVNTARNQLCDGLLGEGLLCLLIYMAISLFKLPGTELLTFLVIATRIIPKISAVNEARVRITEQFPRVVLLPEILSGRSAPALAWGTREKARFEDRIRFDRVAFSYPEGRLPSLQGVDLEIVKDQTLAVVGESGSGKSTLARLLLRLFDPTSGAVTVDGVPLPELRQEDWSRLVTVVSQDTFIFDDTVEANVKYGSHDASAERFWEALRRARAEEFVKAMPQGERTRLGERGVRLSGGQRQRIAIARAFLRDSPILILDEATSAMDAVNERLIHDAILDLARGRTVVIIAHRFTTIREADRIVVFEKGRLVESGTHDELAAGGGLYRRFLELQTG